MESMQCQTRCGRLSFCALPAGHKPIEVISIQGDTAVNDVELGADLTLSIRADFLGNSVAGCVFYLAVLSGFFVLAEEVPFSQGKLLFGASEFINDVLSHGQTPGGPAGHGSTRVSCGYGTPEQYAGALNEVNWPV